MLWAGVPALFVVVEATGFVDSPLGILYGAFVFPVLLVFWTGSCLLSSIWFVRFVKKRAWRSTFLAAVLPVAWFIGMVHASGNPLGPYYAAEYVGQAIRFATLKTQYDAAVARLPSKPPRLHVFDWGGLFFAWDGVIYDAADEVALPYARRTPRTRSGELDALCDAEPL